MTAVEQDVAFVLADLSGYVALTEAHGNIEAAQVIERFVALATAALTPGARLLERAGDQVVIAAAEASAALETALRLRSAAGRESMFPMVRAGAHMGRVLERDGAYFGAALNVTARVAAHAQPGQILCTAPVAVAARTLPGVELHPLGPVTFRHLVEPVQLFEVVGVLEAAGSVGIDPVCRMQVDPSRAVARAVQNNITYYFCSDSCAAAFARQPEAYVGR